MTLMVVLKEPHPRETDGLIACLERKIEDQMEAAKEVYETWKASHLDVSGSDMVLRRGEETARKIRSLPDPEAFHTDVEELHEARNKRDSLQKSFDLMV